jgi:hypothetical protein
MLSIFSAPYQLVTVFVYLSSQIAPINFTINGFTYPHITIYLIKEIKNGPENEAHQFRGTQPSGGVLENTRSPTSLAHGANDAAGATHRRQIGGSL